ncbi:MAG: UvrD-helicase domain-containing protein [Chloroflexota bacterium]|nr:UvrD-helicase domain-containing protein [Chloroflexota bacterium]
MGEQSLLIVLLVAFVVGGGGLGLLLPRLLAKRAARRRRLHAEAEEGFCRLQHAIAALFGGEYLAASEVDAWRSAHADALALATDDRFVRHLPEPSAGEARAWCAQLRDLDAAVRQHNERFVALRLREEREALDRVEQYPLTERQRVAIVTGEDTTLVIAGAGTGKTSTIVGKVDYLIRRGLAAPGEILVLAFARKASEELKGRLVRLGGHGGVSVSTFHALGLQIVAQVEGRRPSVSPLAEDERALQRFVDDRVRELLVRPDQRPLLVAFFSALLDEEPPGGGVATGDEFIRAQRAAGLRDLTGRQLKSREEVQIANWLTLGGIRWEYERDYPIDTATEARRQYRPDFYLPDHDLYLEHFGIDVNGDTRPGIDRERYHADMAWKRALHAAHGTALVETYSYFREQGGLIARLEVLLRARGVEPRPLTEDDIARIEAEANRPFSTFGALLAQFLKLYRGNGCSPESALRKAASERDRVFLRLFGYVRERYEAELRREGAIDFDDMINRARGHMRAGRYRGGFTYLVVDEFQDISENRLGLLQDLRAQVPHGRLFVVGDDWQAIYRFTGADVGIITDLPRHVGATARVDLDTTFRYGQELLDFSSTFVMANDRQLRKSLRAHHGAWGEFPACVVFQGGQRDAGLEAALETACRDIAARQGGAPATLFVLGRYRLGEARKGRFDALFRRLRGQGLTAEYHTAHAAKGKEADYVIVVEMEAGEYGFPANVSDDPVLKMVLTAPEPFPHAEERRLFYVAVTRARRRVYLIAPRDNVSPFIDPGILGDDTLRAYVETIGEVSPRYRCPDCGGQTIRRTCGPHGVFWACAHFPLCRGRLDACGRGCEGGLAAPGGGPGERVYRCTVCGREAEPCPRCGGSLRERVGRHGSFLGCSRWNGGAGCTYTRGV